MHAAWFVPADSRKGKFKDNLLGQLSTEQLMTAAGKTS